MLSTDDDDKEGVGRGNGLDSHTKHQERPVGQSSRLSSDSRSLPRTGKDDDYSTASYLETTFPPVEILSPNALFINSTSGAAAVKVLVKWFNPACCDARIYHRSHQCTPTMKEEMGLTSRTFLSPSSSATPHSVFPPAAFLALRTPTPAHNSLLLTFTPSTSPLIDSSATLKSSSSFLKLVPLLGLRTDRRAVRARSRADSTAAF